MRSCTFHDVSGHDTSAGRVRYQICSGCGRYRVLLGWEVQGDLVRSVPCDLQRPGPADPAQGPARRSAVTAP
ncbi:MAG: hypothetical protein OJJ54_07620 [Pseudonocardia sp.]|nr:hypothetical protein [Pseudonocardia sp.]